MDVVSPVFGLDLGLHLACGKTVALGFLALIDHSLFMMRMG
jgi:hypothetical protein